MATTGPADITHLVTSAINACRAKLLDLTLANRLLSFKHSEKSRNHVRVIDEIPEILFEKLCNDRPLSFVGIEEPEVLPDDERNPSFESALKDCKTADTKYIEGMTLLGKRPRRSEVARLERELRDRVRTELGMPSRKTARNVTDRAKELEIDASYDLPRPNEETLRKHNDNKIQTLLYRDILEAKLSAVRDADRTLNQDSGVNALYCAFGFVEWYETPQSETPLYAPVLFLPIELQRSLSNGQYTYLIKQRDDDVETNVTFAEKLKRDFGLELPLWSDELTLAEYFASIEQLLSKAQRRWKLRRWVTVGLFTFSKLVMYKDLDQSAWNGKLVEHQILRDIFAGADHSSDGFSSLIHDIDALEKSGEAPLLVTDADSSQHSAIVDVISGKNLVIQGPPGTGKSQTIANIIGAALCAGKTVLFVAEKMAALSVVKSRLDHYGLGEFCLELHSNRTRKTAVRDALAARLNYAAPRITESELVALRRHWDLAKEELLYYVNRIRHTFGETGLTVHQVLQGNVVRNERSNKLHPEVRKIALVTVDTLDPQERNRCEDIAALLESKSRDCGARWKSIWNHPWCGLRNSELQTHDIDRIISAFQLWIAAADQLIAAITTSEDETGWSIGQTANSAKKFVNSVSSLPSCPKDLDPVLFHHLNSAVGRPIVSAAISWIENLIHNKANLSELATDPSSLLTSGSKKLQDLASRLSKLGLNLDGAALKGEITDRLTKADRAEKAVPAAEDICALLQAPGSVTSLKHSVVAAKIAIRLSSSNIAFRCHETLEESNILEYRRAQAWSSNIRNSERRLREVFDLSALPPREEINAAGRVLASASLWQRLFGADCRKARKCFRDLARVNYIKSKDKEIPGFLLDLAMYLGEVTAFNTDSRLIHAAGAHFAGIDTPWQQLLDVAEWNVEIFAELSARNEYCDFWKQFLQQSDEKTFRAFRQYASGEAFGAWATAILEAPASNRNFKEYTQMVRLIATESAALFANLNSLQLSNYSDLCSSAELVQTIEKTLINLDSPEVIAICPGGSGSDHISLKATLEFAEALIQQDLPPETIARLFSTDVDQYMCLLKSSSLLIGAAIGKFEFAQAEAVELGSLKAETWLVAEHWSQPLDVIRNRARVAIDNAFDLPQFLDFLRVEEAALNSALGPVIASYGSLKLEYDNVPAAFDFCFYRTCADEILRADGKLAKHSGASHELLRRRYQQLDREMILLNRKVVAHKCRSRQIDWGTNAAKVSEKTGLALIQHQIGLQTRHTPIRELFKRSGTAVLGLKPCLMMSPMSVAQFLAPGTLTFDLVVMDEASQIRPEEALGAVARGRQVVVVGDPKQLPPTSFFERIGVDSDTDDEDEDDIQQLAGQESILDLATSAYAPMRRLLWHYRSQHHDLIAFSNKEFYEDALIVFPAPHGPQDGYGVHSTYVKGRYMSRVNRDEAEAIVSAAQEFMHSSPNHSLGIVAVNQPQRDLISTMMDDLCATDPQCEEYRSRWSTEIEQFFVKNLENVQGDERDTIFISTVYGPDDSGKLHQRFGPINSVHGHRRLNVLFTRAKKQVRLFTSMSPGEIAITPNSKVGVTALRNYLQYASDGTLTFPKFSSKNFDSEFEKWVAESLAAKGFEVVPQLGVSGYFLDLAILNPEKPGSYLCAVECDGATYHSAGSARDRDRLRQLVLENLGWKIYRVWSTDWFRNPVLELQKLLAFVEEQLASTSN